MEEQQESYRKLLGRLRAATRLGVRLIACYSGVSTSRFYEIEHGGGMGMISFLRLLTFYLSLRGYVFHHQELVQSLEEAFCQGESVWLVMGRSGRPDFSGEAIVLLEKDGADPEQAGTEACGLPDFIRTASPGGTK